MSFYKDPDKCFGFKLELVDEFIEINPSAFEPFVGHHQGLFASVKILFFYIIVKITQTFCWIKLRRWWYRTNLKQNAINGNRIFIQRNRIFIQRNSIF